MADDGADRTKRNGKHHHQRLQVTAKGHRQQRVNHAHGQSKTAPQGGCGFTHIGLAALKTPGQAGEVRPKLRQNFILYHFKHLTDGGLGLYVGAHGDYPTTVATVNGSERLADGYVCHIHQRNFLAFRRPNHEVIQIIEVLALVFRQAYADFVFVDATQLAHGNSAIEGIAQLAANLGAGQAKCPALIRQADVELGFAHGVAVIDIPGLADLLKFLEKALAGLGQNVDVGVAQVDTDVVPPATRALFRGKRDFIDALEITQFVAPEFDDFADRHVTLLLRAQHQLHINVTITPHVGLDALGVAFQIVFFKQPLGIAGNFHGKLTRLAGRGSYRQTHVCLNFIGRGFGHHDHAHMAADRIGATDHHNGQRHHHGYVPKAQ